MPVFEEEYDDGDDMTEEVVFIVALIVTFNPDERLFLSLESVQSIANHVVIVDNDSSDKSFMDHLKSDFNKNTITILELQTNLGIGGALNYGVEYIKSNFSVDYVFTLDQDTVLVENNLGNIIKEANERFNRIGIIALGTDKTLEKTDYKEIRYVITSGNLVRVEIFNNVKYREEFFMDQVDFDFDYEVRKCGYRIILVDGYLIDHRLGIKLKKRAYEPPFRLYYIIRNSTVLLMERKIPFTIYAYQIIYWTRSSIFHDGIVRYSRTLILGIIDGLARKLGKKIDFQK